MNMNQHGSKLHTRQAAGALVITTKCRTQENIPMEAML
jgi:hypothetical protein